MADLFLQSHGAQPFTWGRLRTTSRFGNATWKWCVKQTPATWSCC